MRVESVFMDGVTVECSVDHCGVANFASEAVSLGPFDLKERAADSYSQEGTEVTCRVCGKSFSITATNDLEGVQLDCPVLPREAVFFRIAKVELPERPDPETWLDEDEDERDEGPNPAWGADP